MTEEITPTTQANEAQALAETQHEQATNRSTREIGKNSQGEPTLYPSDVEMVSTQFNLTSEEAERLILAGDVSQSAADDLKAGRKVYRQRFEAVDASEASHPLAAADARAAATEAAATPSGPDPALPTSGPYGPNAEYDETTAPVDKDHVPAEAVAAVQAAAATEAAATLGDDDGVTRSDDLV